MTNRTYKALCILPALTLLPATTLAAGGGHHEPHVADLFWHAINFPLFLLLLLVLTRKPFKRFWLERRSVIQDKVTRGARELEQAKERLRIAEEQLKTLGTEIDSLKAAILKDTKREAEELLQEAREHAARIESQMQQTIESERAAVQRAVREELAQAVIERAEQKVRSANTVDSDKSLRDAARGGIRTLIQ